MKRIVLFTCLLVSLTGFSQSSEERIKSLANDMCDCIAPSLDTLHPALKSLMIDMAEQGEDSATLRFAAWYAKASEKDMAIINRQLAMLDKGDQMPGLQDCESTLSAKYPETVEDLKTTDKVLYEKLAAHMMKTPKCKFLGAMLKIGAKEEGK